MKYLYSLYSVLGTSELDAHTQHTKQGTHPLDMLKKNTYISDFSHLSTASPGLDRSMEIKM